MNSTDRFAGRTAIITGGASGIGKMTAARIAAEGGRVLLWDVDAAALHETKAEIGNINVRAIDVSDQMAVAGATAEARNTLGGQIDILINAAGIKGAAAPVDQYPIDSWLRVLDVNLNGTFYCCRAVVPYMTARGYGRIVNLCAERDAGDADAPAYAAAKAGVIGFTRSIAGQLAAKSIVAHAITPAQSDAVAMICAMAAEESGAAL